ncbi:sigma-70 family RNA polymerase sigma factor [Fontivita pretiosa]|uniref:sigma-70 family RNA polymerase sigma factor n=1 Tax=Fontivita pretiosa TaxID=2989684 RepID=UPI003D185BD4
MNRTPQRPQCTWSQLSPSHLNLIRAMAGQLRRRLPPTVEPGDLIGDGYVGLRSAMKRFDPSRGVPFEQFALRRIRGAMLDGLRQRDFPHRRSRRDDLPTPQFQPLDPDQLLDRSHALSRLVQRLWLQNQLQHLPRRTRLVLQLYYLEAVPMAAIAVCLGISQPRVCQLHAAGLRKLRRQIHTAGPDVANPNRATLGKTSRPRDTASARGV